MDLRTKEHNELINVELYNADKTKKKINWILIVGIACIVCVGIFAGVKLGGKRVRVS